MRKKTERILKLKKACACVPRRIAGGKELHKRYAFFAVSALLLLSLLVSKPALTVTQGDLPSDVTGPSLLRQGWAIETACSTPHLWYVANNDSPSIALHSENNLPYISYTLMSSFISGRAHVMFSTFDGTRKYWVNKTVGESSSPHTGPSDIALDSQNRPHICYFDADSEDLKYARWTGVDWDTDTVDWVTGGSVGEYCSIALDSHDTPHISYYYDSFWGGGELWYAKRNGQDWDLVCVDEEIDDTGVYTSIAVDSQDRPHIAYRTNSGSLVIRYATLLEGSWHKLTVTPPEDVSNTMPCIALDSHDTPHISYAQVQSHGIGSCSLRYATWTGWEWITEPVDTAPDSGYYSSLAFDSRDVPHISYWCDPQSGPDWRIRRLKYATWTGSPTWSIEVVDKEGRWDEWGIARLGSPKSSIAVDSEDNPHIAYSTEFEVKYAKRIFYDPYEAFSVAQFTSIEAAYNALANGYVDMVSSIGWSDALFPAGLEEAGGFLTADLAEYAMTDPNIVLGRVAANNMYTIDINNNYTVSSIVSVLNDEKVRQAVFVLMEKYPWLFDTVIRDYGVRIDCAIPDPLRGWGNTSLSYPNYPYEYNPLQAALLLDAAGLAQGATPNPYHDPAYNGSAAFIRTYPVDHPKAGQNLDPLVFCIRADDNRRMQVGLRLMGNVRKAGLPVSPVLGDQQALFTRVYVDRDYHLYTGASTTWKLPTHVAFQYHSRYWQPGGPNHVTGVNASGQPNYPELDALLDNFYYATTYAEAVSACQRAMGLFTELAISIPLWSDWSYAAWRKDLLGVVNMLGYGPLNPYTLMNAYKADGSTIKIGTWPTPETVNILYASTVGDYAYLDPMTLYASVDTPPYNPAVDQPGFVSDWTVGTWDDGGELKTKLTKTLRSRGFFLEPATSNLTYARQVAVEDLYMSMWYTYAVADSWHHPKCQDVHHIDLRPSKGEVDIYFDSLSYWHPYAASGPLLPMHTWMAQGDTLVNQTVETFINPATPGVVALASDPVWVSLVTFNNVTLTPFIDYNIVKGKLEIFTALSSGLLEVQYLHPGDPTGTTPGNLPWQTMFEGAGQYCATTFDSLAGTITFTANPLYYMETRVLGETNFARNPSGAHEIDIFDVILVASAYGSQGNGVPSSNWFPGADLAPEAGKIDIFDIITVCSKYGEEWDYPS